MFRRFINFLRRRTLVQQYFLASSLIMVVGMLGIGSWVVQEIEQGVVHSTAMTTSLYIESNIEPNLSKLTTSSSLSEQGITELDDLLKNTPLGDQIVVLKVWSLDGKVLYSNIHQSIGQKFPIEDRLAVSLAGETTTRISALDSDENVAERSFGRLIETYSPLHLEGTTQVIGAIEFYQKMDDLEALISSAQFGSWAVVAGGLAVIYLLLGLFVRRAGQTIVSQQDALRGQVVKLTDLLAENKLLNERVRNAARKFASFNEHTYRRIGSEIHDGPAQELSLALLKIDDILARGEALEEGKRPVLPAPTSEHAPTELMSEIQTNLTQAMHELRALASGLSLPELSGLSLEETILRPIRTHERKTATKVKIELMPLPPQAQLAIKITLYRLIQEALNNCFRHAAGAGQAVSVCYSDQDLNIEISDQGPGFDVDSWKTTEDHLGLVGMRERVEALGGVFKIESKVGQGTRIMACLSLQAEGMD